MDAKTTLVFFLLMFVFGCDDSKSHKPAKPLPTPTPTIEETAGNEFKKIVAGYNGKYVPVGHRTDDHQLRYRQVLRVQYNIEQPHSLAQPLKGVIILTAPIDLTTLKPGNAGTYTLTLTYTFKDNAWGYNTCDILIDGFKDGSFLRNFHSDGTVFRPDLVIAEPVAAPIQTRMDTWFIVTYNDIPGSPKDAWDFKRKMIVAAWTKQEVVQHFGKPRVWYGKPIGMLGLLEDDVWVYDYKPDTILIDPVTLIRVSGFGVIFTNGKVSNIDLDYNVDNFAQHRKML